MPAWCGVSLVGLPQLETSQKKNGERTKQKIGGCGCSTFQQQCHASTDCCDFLLACGDTGCDDHPVCCKPAGAKCEEDCDCCGTTSAGKNRASARRSSAATHRKRAASRRRAADDDEICNFVAIAAAFQFHKRSAAAPPAPNAGRICDCCFPFEAMKTWRSAWLQPPSARRTRWLARHQTGSRTAARRSFPNAAMKARSPVAAKRIPGLLCGSA